MTNRNLEYFERRLGEERDAAAKARTERLATSHLKLAQCYEAVLRAYAGEAHAACRLQG